MKKAEEIQFIIFFNEDIIVRALSELFNNAIVFVDIKPEFQLNI